MGPPIAAFPMVPSGKTIAIEAAIQASADLKRQKNNSGMAYATSRRNEERLRRRSKKMSKDFQEAMEKNVKRKLDSMSGSQNNRKLGLKVAQFIPGKGLEIVGAQVENDPSIYCPLGLKGEKIVDPLDETFKTIKGRQISMDFAFKLINTRSGLLDHVKQSRVTVMNCFRHVNPDSFNNMKTGWHETITGTAAQILEKQQSNQKWNTSLGPDASLVRCGTGGAYAQGAGCGTWRGYFGNHAASYAGVFSGEAASNTLMSPYRYPNNMEVLYSRVNRQLLENYGWMLNPFKFTGFSNNSPATATADVGESVQLTTWKNPGAKSLDFTQVVTAAEQSSRKASFPCQVNTANDGGFEWHSQFGPGKLSYQFSNDGTNPVCIDICVVGVKKDQPVAVNLLEHICRYNYAAHKYANRGATDLNGFQTNGATSVLTESFGHDEWHDNAKMPFMPDTCFKNPPSLIDASDVTFGSQSISGKEVFEIMAQGKKNPFKVIKRDQFIVSSGSNRAWNTTLPSIKYRPTLYEDSEYPVESTSWETSQLATTADEYTFVLVIGASGLPKPVEEISKVTYASGELLDSEGQEPTGNKNIDQKGILDRQPSTCNVAVVGTYKETIYPTYPQDTSSINFVNGRITEPYFRTAPTRYTPSAYHLKPLACNTVDIATLGQVVQVAQDGVIGVGAISTQKGN